MLPMSLALRITTMRATVFDARARQVTRCPPGGSGSFMMCRDMQRQRGFVAASASRTSHADEGSQVKADVADKPAVDERTAAQHGDASRHGTSQQLDVKGFMDEMMDAEKIGKRGESWFVLQALLLFAIAVPLPPLQVVADVAGASALTAGVALMLLGQQSLGNNLSPFPDPRSDGQLVTTGIFEHVRHPMYGGLIAASFGLGAVTHDSLRLLLACALFVALEYKTRIEEDFLQAKYPDYEKYKQSAKKFFPLLYYASFFPLLYYASFFPLLYYASFFPLLYYASFFPLLY